MSDTESDSQVQASLPLHRNTDEKPPNDAPGADASAARSDDSDTESDATATDDEDEQPSVDVRKIAHIISSGDHRPSSNGEIVAAAVVSPIRPSGSSDPPGAADLPSTAPAASMPHKDDLSHAIEGNHGAVLPSATSRPPDSSSDRGQGRQPLRRAGGVYLPPHLRK